MRLLFAIAVALLCAAAKPFNPTMVTDLVEAMHPGVDVTDPISLATALSHDVDVTDVPMVTQHRKIGRQWFKDVVGAPYVNLTTAPQQVHISVASETELTVMWLTSNVSNNAIAEWRDAVTNTQHSAKGQSYTYDPIAVFPWYGTVHLCKMGPLVPGRTYNYTVGDPALLTKSQVFTVVAPNLNKASIHVAIGGDMGTYQLVGHLVARQMHDYDKTVLPLDAFWHLGDIAYSTLDPPKDNIEQFWDLFLQQEQSLAAHVPMHVTFGNHDFSGGDSAAFINRFRNPPINGGHGNFYWSYEHGPIRYVSMCTEVALVPSICDYAPGSTQYKWIEEQFASVNRTKTPWLVLVGHRPMYSSDKATDSGPVREYIEPLMLKYKVDVGMYGHMHETEVVGPVADHVANLSSVRAVGPNAWNVTKASQPVHLTMGTLGAVIAEHYVHPQPKWSLFRSGSFFDAPYGFVSLKATRQTLSYEFHVQDTGKTLWSLNMHK